MSEEREVRNQVFAQHAQAMGVQQQTQGMPTTTQAEQVKADFGLEIPVETIPLPSCGKVYPIGSALSGKETVDIRALTTREEDILTNTVYLKKGTVISELIKSCLVDKTIDPGQMIGGDRNTLMVAIRITGYGHEYEADVPCDNPECTAGKTTRPFDLSKLQIKRLEIDPIRPGTNMFQFTLPSTKKVVTFRFLTGKDEEEIMATQQKQKKLQLQQPETAVTTSLLYSIVAIDNVDDRNKIAGFVRMMPAKDSKALRDYIRKNEPGIQMKQETACPVCGHSEEVSMPLSVSFLWPSSNA